MKREDRRRKMRATMMSFLYCQYGPGDGNKLDEISGKFQTAFAPPALIFGKSY